MRTGEERRQLNQIGKGWPLIRHWCINRIANTAHVTWFFAARIYLVCGAEKRFVNSDRKHTAETMKNRSGLASSIFARSAKA
jgi:hypothetical protein